MSWRIIEGDVRERLAELESESVQTCVTSPPYWGLRDYDVAGQIGLEGSLADYLDALVEVFHQVGRVLRDDGTLWLNMGDAYNAGTRADRRPQRGLNGYGKHGYWSNPRISKRVNADDLKPKDLIGMPWLLAFALRNDGWYLRRDIIWHKPAPMPESVTDRPTTAHEYLFLFSREPRYFYNADAIRRPLAPKTLTTFGTQHKRNGAGGLVKADNWARDIPERQPRLDDSGQPVGANAVSVWSIPSYGYPEAHFATFPPKLIEPCILAGSPPFVLECPSCGIEFKHHETRAMQGVRGAVHDAEAGEVHGGVLQSQVREPLSLASEIDGQGSLHGREGLRPGSGASASEGIEGRLCDGASVGDGGSPGATAGSDRSGASLEWEQGRQPTDASGEANYLSPLPGQDRGERSCPACGTALVERRSIVLDPFAGSGTTGLVALRHDRSFVGIELNPDYCEMARNRIRDDAPLLNAHLEAA